MWHLIIKEMRAGRRQAMAAAGSLAVACGLLWLIATLVLGGYSALTGRLFVNLPDNIVSVERINSSSLLLNLFNRDNGGGRGLTAAQLRDLSTLSGVEAVWPRLDVKVPMVASGGSSLFGSALSTDLFASGLPGELLAASGDLPPDFTDREGEKIPVLISPVLLEMYNSTVAPALGAPPLSAGTLEGLSFNLTLGRSYMMGQKSAVGQERCYIAGQSRLATTLGFSVPLATAERWLKSYAPGQELTYSGVYLKLAAGTSRLALQKELLARGLDFDAEGRRLAEISAIIYYGLAGFGGCLLLLSLLAISQAISHLTARRGPALKVMTAVGAGRWQLAVLILSIAALLGAAGVTGGIIGGRILLFFVNNFLTAQTGLLGALGLQKIPVSWCLTLLVWCLGFVTALLAALPAAFSCRRFYGSAKEYC